MQLVYRGLAYDPASQTFESTQAETVGRFRGLPYVVGKAASTPSASANVTLRYRGLSY
jgi:hypothetical protein